MPTLSLPQLERKLASAQAKLSRLKARAFTIKKRSWQRQDDQAVKIIKTRLQKSPSVPKT